MGGGEETRGGERGKNEVSVLLLCCLGFCAQTWERRGLACSCLFAFCLCRPWSVCRGRRYEVCFQDTHGIGTLYQPPDDLAAFDEQPRSAAITGSWSNSLLNSMTSSGSLPVRRGSARAGLNLCQPSFSGFPSCSYCTAQVPGTANRPVPTGFDASGPIREPGSWTDAPLPAPPPFNSCIASTGRH